MTSGPWAVETEALVKTFGDTRAVDELHLGVPEGSVVGLLGPNGAGKTTVVRILTTLLRPDAGTARVFGHEVTDNPAAVRELIALTGQFASIDDDLSGAENLGIHARLRGLPRRSAVTRARELLDRLELTDAAHRPVKTYSGGMKRRLDIATSLVVVPRLLVLDEPTTGMDPRIRGEVWTLVQDLVTQGTTVLLTTQYLDEADQFADRIVVVDHGRVVADDTPTTLKASVGSGILTVHPADSGHVALTARVLTARLGAPAETTADDREIRIRVSDHQTRDGQIMSALSQLPAEGVTLSSFALARPNLDEVFLALTGRTAAEPQNDEPQEQIP